MTRHRELLESPLLARRAAIFTDAERVIADPVVRNRGTIGGALCQADPSEDLSAVCAAVDARDGDPRPRRRARASTCPSFTAGPTGPRSATTRCWSRSASRCAEHSGSAYEKVDRRVGDWAVAAAGRLADRCDATARDRQIGRDRARRGRAPTSPAPRPRRELRGREPPPSGWPTRAGERAAACSPGHRPARLGRVQAPRRRRADRRGRCGARRPARTRGPGAVMQVTVAVNGEEHTRDVEPRMLLVHFLRDELRLTGTHWGCDTSNCGTCVVLMDGEPVKSCTVLAATAAGHEIRTVEGLEVDGVLDPVQRGLQRGARAAVRLLHLRDDADRPRAAGPPRGAGRGRSPTRRSARRSPARSAAAPATRRS